jgi:hypothetical protein
MDIEQVKAILSDNMRLTPSDHRQVLIMAQSCQAQALDLMKLKYYMQKEKLDLTTEDLIAEVKIIRDELLRDLLEGYMRI